MAQSRFACVRRLCSRSNIRMSSTSSSAKKGSSSSSHSTLNEEELQKFRAMASTWWDPQGPLFALHSMNQLRVPLITDGLQKTGKIMNKDVLEPLSGLRILDVGCGGGILCERLARLGAHVTGIDACQENVELARQHATLDNNLDGRINYMATTVEDLKHSVDEPFDAVVASEVIEHVDNPELFVLKCSEHVDKNEGSMFFTTINRTTRSWMAAIIAAENIFGVVPRGTHDWDKFVTPEELTRMVERGGCRVRLVHGMFYFPLVNKWSWFPDPSVNYAIHAVKQKQTTPPDQGSKI